MDGDENIGARPVMAVAFGVDEPTFKLIQAALPHVKFRALPLEISAMLKPQLDFEPDLIFCGQFDSKISLVEIAQGVRSMYGTAPIYYATSTRTGFDRKELTKNGFSDAFLMPIDQGVLHDLISEGSADFKDVPLIDINPETVLDFDTYILLPMNRKYVRFSRAGYPLEAARAQRLISHQVATVQVSRHDLKKFYDFTAQQLRKLQDGPSITETERRERMHAAVRSLFTGLLTNASEIQDCSQIVHSYVLAGNDETASLYEKILRLVSNSRDGYQHVSNVSTMAALFAMALLPDSAEAIALAGLLHDIGMADVPANVQIKAPAQRTPEEQLQYEAHPLNSVRLLKARNIQIPELVFKIIEQHHERVDGTGYPAHLKGEAVLREAQLVAIADEFDYAMAVEFGKRRPSAQATLDNLMKSPGYDPDLLMGLSSLF